MASQDRIIETAIDPAGLAISEKMQSKLTSRSRAIQNINDGVSLFQVAEGSLGEIQDISVKLRELALHAASDTLDESQRGILNIEYRTMLNEIDRIAETTNFNGKKLLDGKGPMFDFQVGVHHSSQDTISFDTSKLNATSNALGAGSSNLSSKQSAQSSIGTIDTMIKRLGKIRSTVGSKTSRLESAVQNSLIHNESTKAANSRIRDVDLAHASAERASLQIITESVGKTLKLANNKNQKVMRLVTDL